MSNYDAQEALDELFAESPSQAVAYITQAVNAQHQAEMGQLLNQAYQAGSQQADGLIAAQTESAILESDRALNAKYTDWKEIREDVGGYLKEHPHLLPDHVITSPQALANVLDDVTKIVREDSRERVERQKFDRIKAAGSKSYAELHYRSPDTEE